MKAVRPRGRDSASTMVRHVKVLSTLEDITAALQRRGGERPWPIRERSARRRVLAAEVPGYPVGIALLEAPWTIDLPGIARPPGARTGLDMPLRPALM